MLGFEAIVAFLAGLVIYGTSALPDPIPAWWGIVAGSVLAVLMIVTGRFVRYRWGIALGWFWQLVVGAGAHGVEESGGLRFKPIRHTRAGQPLGRHGGWQVEPDRQVGLQQVFMCQIGLWRLSILRQQLQF